MADKIITRTDTFDNWESVNPILEQGEQAWDSSSKKMKVGDGATSWNDLEYATGGNSEIDEVKHKVISGTGRITIPHEVAGNTVKLYIDKGTANVGDIVKITVQSRNLINKEMFCDPNNWEDRGYRFDWRPLKGKDQAFYLTRKGNKDLGTNGDMIDTNQKCIVDGWIYFSGVNEENRDAYYDEYLEDLQLERHCFTNIIPYSKIEYDITLAETAIEITLENLEIYATINCDNPNVILNADYSISSLSYEISTIHKKTFSEIEMPMFGILMKLGGYFEEDYNYHKEIIVTIEEEKVPIIYFLFYAAYCPTELLRYSNLADNIVDDIIEIYQHGLREIIFDGVMLKLDRMQQQYEGIKICIVNTATNFYLSFSIERNHGGSGEGYSKRIESGFVYDWNHSARINIASLGDSDGMEIDTVTKKIILSVESSERTLLWNASAVSYNSKLILNYNDNLPDYIVKNNVTIERNDYIPGENDKYYYPFKLKLSYIGEVTEEIVRKDFGEAMIDIYRS